MKLNHLNLTVTNIPKAIALFEKHLGFNSVEIKGDNVIAILKGYDDFTLVLLWSKEGIVTYPGAFHIGFLRGNAECLVETYRDLIFDEIAVGDEPRKIRNSFRFYFSFKRLLLKLGVMSKRRFSLLSFEWIS